MGEADRAGRQPAEQIAGWRSVHPEDDAVGAGDADQPGPQGGQVDVAVEESVEHVAQVAPLAQLAAQCPLRPAPGAGVVLSDSRAPTAQPAAGRVDARQQPLVTATRAGAAAMDSGRVAGG